MLNTRPSFKDALLAGMIAIAINIAINTAILHLAELIPLQTGGGGLLKLAHQLLGEWIRGSALPAANS